MKVHQLQAGHHPDSKRVGRGIGSGYGKTAGRGTKGQNSRSGGGVRVGFEGGQNPLAKRLPKKRGFNNPNQITYQVVNLNRLSSLKTATVDANTLAAAGLVKSARKPIKVLGEGEVGKLTLRVNAVSAAAQAKISAAGGTIELISTNSTSK
jgi:large subunit ribosomal protein L15